MTQPTRHDDDQGRGPSVPATHSRVTQTDQNNSNAKHSLDPAVAVRDAVGKSDFQHWFATRSRFLLEREQLLVEVPNPFILNWLMKRFRGALVQASQRLLGPSGSFQLRVNPDLLRQPRLTEVTVAATDTAGPATKVAVEAVCHNASSSKPVDRPTVDGVATHSRRRFRSFDSFIGADCNQLAVLASHQVAAKPGERFNPLYLHGGTGTGKTHLLEAIYSDVRRRHRGLNVVYLSSEGFTNYFTAALSGRTIPSFRQRFRNVDVLLIDNVEFLDNKRATQEEFLHTMVQVIEHGGQVVVSADRHPRMLTKHREELTTRFQSGLVCRIESPDDHLRQQLVRSIAATQAASFSDDALDYVARRCRRNVRELQGAMNSLDGHFALTTKRITVAVARGVLGELDEESKRLVRISDVERVVCEAFGVTATELRSKTRRKAISLPRSLAMFICRKLTQSAYREIGLYFGGRDHSTVVAAEKRVADWIVANEPLKVPTSCRARKMADIVNELEDRLLAMAS
jgi:chromosomal replication initiator protein